MNKAVSDVKVPFDHLVGGNSDGQLGLGDTDPVSGATVVTGGDALH